MARISLITVFLTFTPIVTGASEIHNTARSNAMKLTLELRNGSGDDPMTVIWLETKKRKFVRTLYMVSRDKKWFHSLNTWYKKHKKAKETRKSLDAVTGATMKWKSKRTIRLSLRVDEQERLLKGGYVIRFETAKDKGRHYRSFKIPVDSKTLQGGSFTHKGYLKRVTLRLVRRKHARKKRVNPKAADADLSGSRPASGDQTRIAATARAQKVSRRGDT